MAALQPESEPTAAAQLDAHPESPSSATRPPVARATVAQLRREYLLQSLHERDADPSPFRQFARWLEQARRTVSGEANAMTVATATPDGIPSARVVLLKELDERGFVFYTNYGSQKGRGLDDRALVAVGPHPRPPAPARGRGGGPTPRR